MVCFHEMIDRFTHLSLNGNTDNRDVLPVIMMDQIEVLEVDPQLYFQVLRPFRAIRRALKERAEEQVTKEVADMMYARKAAIRALVANFEDVFLMLVKADICVSVQEVANRVDALRKDIYANDRHLFVDSAVDFEGINDSFLTIGLRLNEIYVSLGGEPHQ